MSAGERLNEIRNYGIVVRFLSDAEQQIKAWSTPEQEERRMDVLQELHAFARFRYGITPGIDARVKHIHEGKSP